MANYERRDEQRMGDRTGDRVERRDQVQKPTHGFYERACGRLRKALGELPNRELLERMRHDAEAAWGGPAEHGRRGPGRRPERDAWYDEVETRFRESLGEYPDRETIARWREDAEAAWRERSERPRREGRRFVAREHRELEGERYRGGERMLTERRIPDRGYSVGPDEGGMRRGGYGGAYGGGYGAGGYGGPSGAGGYGGGGSMGYGGFGRRFGDYDERFEQPGEPRRRR